MLFNAVQNVKYRYNNLKKYHGKFLHIYTVYFTNSLDGHLRPYALKTLFTLLLVYLINSRRASKDQKYKLYFVNPCVVFGSVVCFQYLLKYSNYLFLTTDIYIYSRVMCFFTHIIYFLFIKILYKKDFKCGTENEKY